MWKSILLFNKLKSKVKKFRILSLDPSFNLISEDGEHFPFYKYQVISDISSELDLENEIYPLIEGEGKTIFSDLGNRIQLDGLFKWIKESNYLFNYKLKVISDGFYFLKEDGSKLYFTKGLEINAFEDDLMNFPLIEGEGNIIFSETGDRLIANVPFQWIPIYI